MSKKTRKRRAKYRARISPKLSGVKEVVQRPQQVNLSPKQATVAKTPIAMYQPSNRHAYVREDLKRTAIIAGPMFLLLIILHFFLH